MHSSDFKNLQSLEVCGGLITDAGVKNIKDLKALTLLNLSQNGNLTDKSLELISGMSLVYLLRSSGMKAFNTQFIYLFAYLPCVQASLPWSP